MDPHPTDPDQPVTVTRSEEELALGVRDVEGGRVRIRKRIVTESRTIQVRREILEVEHLDAAPPGSPPSADPDWSGEIILREEEVITQVVPYERVVVSRQTVSQEVEVSADLRREAIELDPGGLR